MIIYTLGDRGKTCPNTKTDTGQNPYTGQNPHTMSFLLRLSS